MKSIATLRNALSLSIADLAGLTGLPESELEQLEVSADMPSLAVARDLALAFGVSVRELLGFEIRGIRPTLRANRPELREDDQIDSRWGHLGVKDDAGRRRWYPIGANTAVQIHEALLEGSNNIVVSTLSQHLLVLFPRNLKQIRLTEDLDGDLSGNDLDHDDTMVPAINGELALAIPFLDTLNLDDEVRLAITNSDELTFATAADTEDLRIQLDQAFNYSASDRFKFAALKAYLDLKTAGAWISGKDREAVVALSDRTCERLDNIEPESVRQLLVAMDLESPGHIMLLTNSPRPQSVYFHVEDIASIVMPLSAIYTSLEPGDYAQAIEDMRIQNAREGTAEAQFVKPSQSARGEQKVHYLPSRKR